MAGGLRKLLGRFSASTPDTTWEDRQRSAERADSEDVSRAEDRQFVTLRGTIKDLTIQPRERTENWLEAEFSDGTGVVTLIWMGRHTIPGIEPGRAIRVVGRISIVDGRRRMYNPEYTLF